MRYFRIRERAGTLIVRHDDGPPFEYLRGGQWVEDGDLIAYFAGQDSPRPEPIAELEAKRFDPNQPRDEQGRWTRSRWGLPKGTPPGLWPATDDQRRVQADYVRYSELTWDQQQAAAYPEQPMHGTWDEVHADQEANRAALGYGGGDTSNPLIRARNAVQSGGYPGPAGDTRLAMSQGVLAAMVRAHRAHNAAVYARRHGMTVDEYEAAVLDRLQDKLDDAPVAVRVGPAILDHILDDGRLKSQYETRTSKGFKDDPEGRRNTDAILFGLPIDTPDQERPIYGYAAIDGLQPAGRFKDSLESDDALSQYGKIAVVLKDRVRNRSTVTFGDSLNQREQTRPTPLTDLGIDSVPFFGGSVTNGVGDDDDTINQGGLNRAGLWGDPLDPDWPPQPNFHESNYAEVQIHGGLTLADVERVVLPAATKKLTDKLDAAGVPWEVLKP